MKGLVGIDELHDTASAQTGLDDFGDPGYREPMTILLDSYRHEAGLTEQGCRTVAAMLETVLVTKLRLRHGHVAQPSAGANSITRPVFVTGLPRTGTTALHRLLCLDPNNQGLELWLTEAPQPRPPVDQWPENPDYQRMREIIRRRDEANPAMNGVHFMTPDTVEECWRAERLSMRSIAFQNLAHLPSYGEWLAGQGMAEAYQGHREMLQLVGLNDPQRTWVLKSPSHLFGLDALLEAYPDALVIQTHRHPAEVVPSVSSLNRQASAGSSSTFDSAQIGRDCLALWARGAAVFARVRSRYAPDQFLDVDFDDLVRDAGAVVAAIYARLGRTFDPALRSLVEATNTQSKTDQRRPDHRYSLAEFDLTEADIDRHFSAYIEAHITHRGQG